MHISALFVPCRLTQTGHGMKGRQGGGRRPRQLLNRNARWSKPSVRCCTKICSLLLCCARKRPNWWNTGVYLTAFSPWLLLSECFPPECLELPVFSGWTACQSYDCHAPAAYHLVCFVSLLLYSCICASLQPDEAAGGRRTQAYNLL